MTSTVVSSIGLAQGSQYKSYKKDKIKYLQPSVRLMTDSNAATNSTITNSTVTNSIITNISDYLFGKKSNSNPMQESGLDNDFKSEACYEGFEGIIGSTGANTQNIQETSEMMKLEDDFSKSMSNYATTHKFLMDKTQNYLSSMPSSTNERNKNIYAVRGQNPDEIHPKWKGCYAGGKGLIYQEDMGNNASLSACKTRASDLGYSNFALSNTTNNEMSKCYVGNSSDNNTASNKTMVSYAFTKNEKATMGGLLKNGQIGTFNDSIANDLVVDLPGVPGCDASVGGMINTKNTVASYGANCTDQKKPKTVKEQLSELCPPNKANPDIIASNYTGINYNYDTYLFGACTAAGTCDSSIPDDISKELINGIKESKMCNANRFNDGHYFYYDGVKDKGEPEGWAKTDCKKLWDDTNSPHMQYECMQQAWQQAGCTTVMNDVDKTLRQKYFPLNASDVNKSMKAYALNTDEEHRTKCYGLDRTKWPVPTVDCSKFGDNDKGLPHKCIQELWNKAGCSTDIGFNESNWTKYYNKKGLIKDMGDWSTMTDEGHRKGCYGTDKSKWPNTPNTPNAPNAPNVSSIQCSKYGNNDQNISVECKQEMWHNEGCTTHYPGGIDWSFSSIKTKEQIQSFFKRIVVDPIQKWQCYETENPIFK